MWITPFFPTPGFDHGYDVSDYTGVDPIHGTLEDFDELVERAHDLGLRVIIDIVPNHSSHQHLWFTKALTGRDSPYRDYYVWRDPAPNGGLPNNWVSHFGGPAWTLDQESGQYYCHLFLPEQPDLNWDNEGVRREFDEILRFWCRRGVDGFRIDVAHGLVKASDFRDNPVVRPTTPDMSNYEVWNSFRHEHDVDQDLTIDIYRRWNRVVAPFGAMLLGEVGVTEPHRVARYKGDGDALHASFFLRPPRMDWRPGELLAATRAMHEADPTHVSWVIDNHDQSRSATRFGGGERGARRSLALMALYVCLGGTPFLYQGQELGLENGDIRPDDYEDPVAVRNVGVEGRDGTRTAMPWRPGPGNGFTTGEPWLHARDRSAAETVAEQLEDPSSWLSRHRDLMAVRRRHPDLWADEATWLDTGREDVAIIVRGDVCVVANLSEEEQTVGLPEGEWSVVYASCGEPMVEHDRAWIPHEATAILAAES